MPILRRTQSRRRVSVSTSVNVSLRKNARYFVWGKKADHFTTIRAGKHFYFSGGLYLARHLAQDVERVCEEQEDQGFKSSGWTY